MNDVLETNSELENQMCKIAYRPSYDHSECQEKEEKTLRERLPEQANGEHILNKSIRDESRDS